MNPFHSWQVCQILLKRSCRIWRLNSPLLTALLSHFQHGQCTKFNSEQFYGGFYSRTFAVFKLCRRLCGNRGNPNNRIWAPGEIKLVEIRNSNPESWRPWALGSDRRYTLHGPKCASTPLSIHPSIHLLADISTYSRRKDLNTGELILTFRAWSGADHHQHIRGEPF